VQKVCLELANDKMTVLNDPQASYKDKMNTLSWLCRAQDLLELSTISEFIAVFKQNLMPI